MSGCRLAFHPLLEGETIARYCYHANDPEYPMGDLPGEIIVATSECLVNPGVVDIGYDVAANVLIVTPVGAQSPATHVFVGEPDDEDGVLLESDFCGDEVKDPM